MQGLPASSIQWGAWQGPGMAGNAGLARRLRQAGMHPIGPQQGLAALGEWCPSRCVARHHLSCARGCKVACIKQKLWGVSPGWALSFHASAQVWREFCCRLVGMCFGRPSHCLCAPKSPRQKRSLHAVCCSMLLTPVPKVTAVPLCRRCTGWQGPGACVGLCSA